MIIELKKIEQVTGGKKHHGKNHGQVALVNPKIAPVYKEATPIHEEIAPIKNKRSGYCTCIQVGPWVKSYHNYGCVKAMIVCQVECEDRGFDGWKLDRDLC